MSSSRTVTVSFRSSLLLAALAALTLNCNSDDGSGVTPPEEVIELSSANVSFSGTEGGASPPPQTIEVTNGGEGTLDGLASSASYTAGQPTGWLSASLSATAAPSTITLTATVGSLPEGTYTASVAVSSAAAENSPQTVSVTLTVGPSAGGGPLIALSSSSQSFTAPQGGAAPPAQTVDITNSGVGTLDGLAADVTYTAGQPTGWLGASLSGPAAPSTLTLTATPGSLPVGTYTASVAITSGVAGNSPQSVAVTFTVTPPAAAPQIALSPTTITFAGTQGGGDPGPQTVDVTNSGTGTLDGLAESVSYTAGQPTGWLSANLSRARAPATLTLAATAGVLTAGTYTASVSVTSAVATNSPQTVNVTFTISAPPGAPSDLTSTPISASQVDLSWIDNSLDEEGFRIESCSNLNCTNFTELMTVGANTSSISIPSLVSRTNYNFRILAFSAAGNSSYSNIASATTLSETGIPEVVVVNNLAPTLVLNEVVQLKLRSSGGFTERDLLSEDDQCWSRRGEGIPSGSSRKFTVPRETTFYLIFIGLGTWESDALGATCPASLPWFKKRFFLNENGGRRWIWIALQGHITQNAEWTITESDDGTIVFRKAGQADIPFNVSNSDPIP
jgi:Fibronectin type III domain